MRGESVASAGARMKRATRVFEAQWDGAVNRTAIAHNAERAAWAIHRHFRGGSGNRASSVEE